MAEVSHISDGTVSTFVRKKIPGMQNVSSSTAVLMSSFRQW